MAASPRVAVIVVNHQDYTERYLPDCYASLMAQTYPAERFSLLIVNNGLPDAETRLTERLAPTARILPLSTNRGWGGGNNAGIRAALEEEYAYIVLLNIDIAADPGWLEELVREAERRPEVQIIQSTILLYGSTRVNSLGNRIQFLGYGYCQGYGQEISQAVRPAVIDFASGASMLVKREVFETVGLFQDDYFMYYDDVEFCWRARLAGFSIGAAESSVCHHKYSFGRKLRWLYHLDRNRLTTLLTLERLRTLALIAPCLVVAEVLVSLYYVGRGWSGSRLKLVWHFMQPSTWAAIGRQRRTIGRLRRRPDADIVAHFAGAIVFAETDNAVIRWICNPLLQGYWNVVRLMIRW